MKKFKLIYFTLIIECLAKYDSHSTKRFIPSVKSLRRPFYNPVLVAAGVYAVNKARNWLEKKQMPGKNII